MKRLHRRYLIGIGVVLLILAGGVLVRQLQRHPSAGHHQQKATYYCPMHPTYTSDRPGDCSICNMKLVKRQEESKKAVTPSDHVPSVGYVPVHLTPQRQQLIGVKTTLAKKEKITKTLRTVGQIAYDPELYQAQEEFLQATRAFKNTQGKENGDLTEQAKRLVDSSRLRLRLLGLSDSLIEEVRQRQSPDQSLLLSDPDGRVWLYAPIYEFELPFVKENQTLSVESPVLPGKILEGVIRSIDPVLEATTRAARVRASLTDPDKTLRPQMYVNVSIAIPLGEVLAVPAEAVFDSGQRQILFVSKGGGIFEPRIVTVGARAEGFYEIKKGVEEGEAVVTNGNFLLDSESRLKAALEGAATPGHSHAP